MELARGAEAVIIRTKDGIEKRREKKSYRHPELDEHLRTKRTKAEARLMEKAKAAGVHVPEVELLDAHTLKIQDIPGEVVVDILDDRPELAEEIGKEIMNLHAANIVHGDLTTSNMILEKDVWFIDFGLAFHSTRDEDKAVDLHVFMQALASKHYKIFPQAFEAFRKGYTNKEVLSRLDVVASRGRNKK